MKHGLQAVMLADSVPVCHVTKQASYDARLVTMEVTYWRGVHAEHLRHRMMSFSVASSRAIPTRRMLQQVLWHPYCPESFGRLIPGMQSGEPLGPVAQWVCRRAWLLARWPVLAGVLLLLLLKVHKQWCNRLLEPWLWVTCIVTGGIGAWEGFWRLRCHKDAEPHIRRMAEMTRDLVRSSTPRKLTVGQAHCPMVSEKDRDTEPDVAWDQEFQMMVSAGRCAAVSYNNHGTGADVVKDHLRARKMQSASPPHMSPFEHQALVAPFAGKGGQWGAGNLPRGWIQHRKMVENDNVGKTLTTLIYYAEKKDE